MTDSWPVRYFKAGAALADEMLGRLKNYNDQYRLEEKTMADGASSCEFFVEGGGSKGRYLMYNPPITGDDITFDDGDTYMVVRRNVDVQDNFVRITIRRKDSA